MSDRLVLLQDHLSLVDWTFGSMLGHLDWPGEQLVAGLAAAFVVGNAAVGYRDIVANVLVGAAPNFGEVVPAFVDA